MSFGGAKLGGQQGASIMIDAEKSTEGFYSLKVQMFLQYWVGVRYYAEGQNWEGYNSLEFTIFNPLKEGFHFTQRVDDLGPSDQHGDYYQKV